MKEQWIFFLCTAVVLDADGDGGGAVRGGDKGRLRGVYVDDLVGGGVVGRAGGDEEEVFVCHDRQGKKRRLGE